MLGLAKKKNNRTDISSPLTLEEMDDKLQSSLESVATELSRVEAEKDKRQTETTKWQARIERVNRLIELNPEKDDALEALFILRSQAENYLENISATVNADDEHMESLREQKLKLTDTVRTLDRMKKKEALNGHLSKVSASLGTASQELRKTDEPDILETSREVNRIIHNANALIELRSDKTYTA